METRNESFDTPVLLIVFNRPDTTRKVFEAIRAVRPAQLFVAADGPRQHVSGEADRCAEVKSIATAVDWKCELKTLFRDSNLGCGKGPASAITWFFSHVEEGIILEDDCVAAPDFFRFCAELLEKYRFDSRIMQIGGNNLTRGKNKEEESSYFFSKLNYIWGWATWRRAWNKFDFDMPWYREITTKEYHKRYYQSFDQDAYFRYVFDQTYATLDHTSVWDYQWQYAKMCHAGLSIVPFRNLVINIGHGTDATHTVKYNDTLPGLKLEKLSFPLRHPEFVMPMFKRDEEIFRGVFTSRWSRIKSRARRFVPTSLIRSLRSFTDSLSAKYANLRTARKKHLPERLV